VVCTAPLRVFSKGFFGADFRGRLRRSAKSNNTMRKSRAKSKIFPKPEWATTVYELRQRLNLSQDAFGQRLHSSAMCISRWERGLHEPTAGGYIELGNLAGAPLCWYFWGRAGLRSEDLRRVMPKIGRQLSRTGALNFQIASAGSGLKTSKAPQLVAIPLQEVVAASHGERKGRQDGDTSRRAS